MRYVLFITCIGLLALSAQCGGSRTLPDFANPAKGGGFTQLATGAGGEKEPSTFWIFGGDVPFTTWRQGTSQALVANGWTSTEERLEGELLASSRDGESCLNYYDLNADTRSIAYTRRLAMILAPKALESSRKFSTVLFVDAGDCP